MKFWCFQISQKANQILDRFLPNEARAEICQIVFFGDFKTPKFHSEINWPLKEVAFIAGKSENQADKIFYLFFHW